MCQQHSSNSSNDGWHVNMWRHFEQWSNFGTGADDVCQCISGRELLSSVNHLFLIFDQRLPWSNCWDKHAQRSTFKHRSCTNERHNLTFWLQVVSVASWVQIKQWPVWEVASLFWNFVFAGPFSGWPHALVWCLDAHDICWHLKVHILQCHLEACHCGCDCASIGDEVSDNTRSRDKSWCGILKIRGECMHLTGWTDSIEESCAHQHAAVLWLAVVLKMPNRNPVSCMMFPQQQRVWHSFEFHFSNSMLQLGHRHGRRNGTGVQSEVQNAVMVRHRSTDRCYQVPYGRSSWKHH